MKERFNRLISKNRIDYAIVFLIVFCLGVFTRQSTEMSVFSDHFGLLSCPAKLAGYQWESVLKYAGYYGPGYFIIYTPILCFVSDPVLLYNLIIDCSIAISSLSGVLLQLILNKCINCGQRKINIIISITTSAFVLHATLIGYFNNESAIVLLTIVLGGLIYLFEETNSRIAKLVLAILLSVIMIYSVSVHIRNINFFIGITGTLVYVALVSDKKINFTSVACILILLVGGGISAYCYKLFPKYFYDMFYPAETALDRMTNTSITLIQSSFPEMIEGILLVLVGNLYESIIHTYGLILATYYYMGKKVVELFGKIKNRKVVEKIDAKELLFVYSSILYVSGLMALCLFAHGTPRMVGYWRYYGSYSAFALAITLVYLFEDDSIDQWEGKFWLFLSSFMLIKYIYIRLEWFSEKYVKFWFVYPHLQETGSLAYGVVLTFTIALLGAVVLIYGKKQYRPVFMSVIVLIYALSNIGNGGLIAYTENYFSDASYRLKVYLMENQLLDSNSKFYYYGNEANYMYFQFMFLGDEISLNYEDAQENDLIFSNRMNEAELPSDVEWSRISLDENEWVFLHNEELEERIKTYLAVQ